MARLSIDINKLKNNKLWMEINRSNDPAGVVNVEVWNDWKKTITSNPVLARLPVKSVAQFISRPWPDEIQNETLSDHVSFLNVLKHKREIQKTIILSMATVAIGYAGNKPEDYADATNADVNTLMHVLGDRPVARLLTDKSWKSWQNTIAMSRLMGMNVDELAAYVGIITTPELANVKISALIRMTLPELKSKYSSFSLDIIALCISTLSIIIKINVKHDSGASAGSADLATIILEHHDTLKEMFSK
jgi:hypothetical protein